MFSCYIFFKCGRNNKQNHTGTTYHCPRLQTRCFIFQADFMPSLIQMHAYKGILKIFYVSLFPIHIQAPATLTWNRKNQSSIFLHINMSIYRGIIIAVKLKLILTQCLIGCLDSVVVKLVDTKAYLFCIIV